MRRGRFTTTRAEKLSGRATLVAGPAWKPRWSAERSVARHGWLGAGHGRQGEGGANGRSSSGVGGGKKGEDDGRALPPPPHVDDGRGEDAMPTMMFLDWDDTLLPTTHLKALGCLDSTGRFVEQPTPQLAVDLAQLEAEILRLLLRAGGGEQLTVAIVTSASRGWVQSSAAQFMPRVAQHLRECEAKLTVRHARDEEGEEEEEGGGGGVYSNPARWKADAMWEELAPLRWGATRGGGGGGGGRAEEGAMGVVCGSGGEGGISTGGAAAAARRVRIISIGDSQWERTAAGVVARKGDIVVTVKLRSGPSCSALRKQLARVCQALPSLVGATASAEINAVATASTTNHERRRTRRSSKATVAAVATPVAGGAAQSVGLGKGGLGGSSKGIARRRGAGVVTTVVTAM
jgi:hypothetical protein